MTRLLLTLLLIAFVPETAADKTPEELNQL